MPDPFYSGVVLFSGGAIYNVKAFGATGLGVHDDSEGIRAAAAALQHAGGGTLLFPPGTYRVFERDGTLATFTGLDGVSVVGMGATLAIPPERRFAPNATMNAFLFRGCSNVVVDGFTGTGPVLDYLNGVFRGVAFVHLEGRNTNVRLPSNRLRGWMAGLWMTRWLEGGDEALRGRATNVEVGVMELTDGLYGLLAANSGDGVRVGRLFTERTLRSYFIYGVRDHRATVEAKDVKGGCVLIRTWDDPSRRFANGCEDIDVTLIDRETTRATDLNVKVDLGWSTALPGAFRNIKLRLDLDYRADARHSGGPALRIEKRTGAAFDTLDRGHVFENFTLTGTIRGRPTAPGVGLIHTPWECAWGKGGTRDRWTNFLFQNLRIESSTPSDLVVDALDRLTLVNVSSTAPIAFRGQDGRQTSRRARIEAVNSSVPNLHAPVQREGRLFSPIASKAADGVRLALPEAWSGSTVDNREAVAGAEWTLPPAVPGLAFTLLRVAPHEVRVSPAGRDCIRGGDPGAALRLDSDGAVLTLRCILEGCWEVVSATGTQSFA
jgi:hypothetical protein